MPLNEFVRTASWWGYRQVRFAAFSIAGKNPLAGGRHRLTAGAEWTSVRGLVSSLRVKPEVIEQNGVGLKWRTAMGDVFTPTGAGADYVGRLTSEMPSAVYALSANDRVVLDAGANVGLFSLHALRCGAESVVAFEPSPGNAECLRRNLRTYIDSGKVRVIEKGVWSEETTLRFSTRNTNNPGGHHLAEDGEIEVPVTSIDRAVEQLQLDRLDYIKMDVESAEVAAIQGARNTISRFRPRLCIATEHTDDLYANTNAVIAAVKPFGYDYVCTETHVYRSPSAGLVLTPYCLLFSPLN